MITKVYALEGRSSAEIQLKVGKAIIPLEFTKGCLDRQNYRPATCLIANKAVQQIIENSPAFGSQITLWKVYGEEEQEAKAEAATAPVAEAKASEESAEKKEEEIPTQQISEYPEVTSKEELIQVLKSLGAKATTLANDTAIKSFITKKKLSFPNFQL